MNWNCRPLDLNPFCWDVFFVFFLIPHGRVGGIVTMTSRATTTLTQESTRSVMIFFVYSLFQFFPTSG